MEVSRDAPQHVCCVFGGLLNKLTKVLKYEINNKILFTDNYNREPHVFLLGPYRQLVRHLEGQCRLHSGQYVQQAHVLGGSTPTENVTPPTNSTPTGYASAPRHHNSRYSGAPFAEETLQILVTLARLWENKRRFLVGCSILCEKYSVSHTQSQVIKRLLANWSAMSREVGVKEISGHSSPESLWLVVNGRVFDMTAFAPSHPGGAQSALTMPRLYLNP